MARRGEKSATTKSSTTRKSTSRKKQSNGCFQWLVIIGGALLLVVALYYGWIEIDMDSGEIRFPTGTERPVPSSTQAPDNNEPSGPVTAQGGWYELYFTRPGTDSLYPEENIVQAMDSAQERIWVASFDFDLDGLTQAMIRAERRGVDVRLIVDTDNSGLPQIQQLLQAKVAVQDDLNRNAFMHNKFIVVDNEEAWFGSMNLTINDVKRNNNNFMRVFSVQLNENFATEFTEMWEGQFGPRSPANTPYPLLSFNNNQSNLDLYFSPEDKPRDRIVEQIDNAQSEIRFLAFSYTDDEIANAMIEAHRRNVSVVGVMETFQSDSTGSEMQPLRNNQIDVRRDGNGGVMHHKVIIIDRRVVIFGSYNFTMSAMRDNDETMVIVEDPQVAAQFLEEWSRVWAIAKEP